MMCSDNGRLELFKFSVERWQQTPISELIEKMRCICPTATKKFQAWLIKSLREFSTSGALRKVLVLAADIWSAASQDPNHYLWIINCTLVLLNRSVAT